ncbi:MAG: hypothetical protein KKA05_04055 [Alphaproteobacteria bacterium]|nr:hypothetical protein [Alphaproteobacteria bacterium]MBU0859125.1 hypothetical protein [Alphaproteobacteria bacterium]
MTIKAVFWNTDSIYGTDSERAVLKTAVELFAAQQFNQVALSPRSAADLTNGLEKAGINNRMVLKMDGESAAARNQSPKIDASTLSETLGSLNSMRVVAKAPVVNADEVIVITNTREDARVALKAGMQAMCVEGQMDSTNFAHFIIDALAKNAPRP